MVVKFKKGSISDIVNIVNSSQELKKKKKQKKNVQESLDETEIAEIKAEPVEPTEGKPVASGKKRKVSSSDNDNAENAPVAEPKGKKKQKGQKNKSTNEAKTAQPKVDKLEKDDAQELPVDEGESNEAKLEKLSRTLFIGNLAANFSLKNLKKSLTQYGNVASIRVRSVAPAKQTLSKKAAYLSKQINPNKKTVNAYVVFRHVDSVQKAIDLNGTEFEGNTIQVDKVEENRAYENTLSIFLGNLSFKATDNDLREFFKDCGEIFSVRIIRDPKTGIGKGFGYVTFKNKDSLVLSLEKNGQSFLGREIRVKTYHYNPASKLNSSKKGGNKRNKFQKQTKSPSSPAKKPSVEVSASPNKARNKSRKVQPEQAKADFKGEMSSKKKLTKKSLKSRIKSNKLNKQKKNFAEILSK